MRILKSLWSNWRKLLGERESGTAIALFRICVGLTILAAVGRTVIAGLAPVVWLDTADGGLLPLLEQPWQVQVLGGLSPAVMWFFVAVNLLLALLMVLGLGGRWTIFLLLQAFLGLSFIDDFIRGCDDKLISNALWLLFLAPSTTTLSLDCRMRNGQWTSQQRIPAWPRYLLIWQLVLVYCMSGLQKVSISWTPAGDYSALYRILQEPTWQRFDMSWLADFYPLTQAATALTWFWEVFFPLLLAALYFRRTRERSGRLRACFNRLRILELYVITGVLLHLGVWGLIDIGPFSWISLSCYVCLTPSKTWDRLFTRLQNRDDANTPAPAASETGGRTKWFVTAFVTFHGVAITLAAFPSPTSVMSRPLWQTPTAQREFVLWADLFNNAGFNVAPQELEESLWQAGTAYAKFREMALAPFAPYYKYCGTRQTWQMFTGPESEPSRLKVEIEERGSWRTLFVQSDPQHNWNKRQLGHEHIRTAIYAVCDDPDSKEFRALARWIANRAASDFPHATRLRVSIERLKIPAPKKARAGEKPTARISGSVTTNLRR